MATSEALDRGAQLPASKDLNAQIFHVQPLENWLNDPNGPCVFQGRVHAFYQYVDDKPHWDWGIKWGHAVSDDGVTWTHLATALTPTQRGADTSGCWSGCVCIDNNGRPQALYTGVRLKGAAYDGPETREYAPQEPMIETVMISRGDAADADLKSWTPGQVLIAEPPLTEHTLEGWRDPFVVRSGDGSRRWQMILGSGYKCDKGKNGTVMLYSADDVEGPWTYDGVIAEGNFTQGRVWECPGLIQISEKSVSDPVDGSEPCYDLLLTIKGETGHRGLHLLAVGAYESVNQNKWAWDPVIYFLGSFDGSKFAAEAKAERLDLGDAAYAPNFYRDAKGRAVMWLWLRDPLEESLVSTKCGCLAVPRLVTYLPVATISANGDRAREHPARLFQEPLPELTKLRKSNVWNVPAADAVEVQAEAGGLEVFSRTPEHLDAELTLERRSASHSGIMLSEDMKGCAVFVLIDWQADELLWLKAPTKDAVEADKVDALIAMASRHMTGPLSLASTLQHLQPGDEGDREGTVTLRVLLDGSAVEVFTSTGQAVSTRIYRSQLTPTTSSLRVVTYGGGTALSGGAWEVGSIWSQKP